MVENLNNQYFTIPDYDIEREKKLKKCLLKFSLKRTVLGFLPYFFGVLFSLFLQRYHSISKKKKKKNCRVYKVFEMILHILKMI